MRASPLMLVSILLAAVGLSCTSESTTDITVPMPVASLSLEPTNAVIQVGTSTKLSAVARDSSGGILSQSAMSWTTSDPHVASLGAGGVVRGKSPGSVEIIATTEGKSDTAAITVTLDPPPPPTLTQLVLTPANITLARGATGQFAVSGTWSDGSTTVPTVTYSATGGTITTGGLYTAGATPGAFRVIVVQQGGTLADTSTVTVTSPTLVRLVLTPASITLTPGGSSQFAVSAKWSDSSTTVPPVTYSATGGIITAGGLYTAGTTAGAYQVIAAQQGGTKADTSIVTITSVPTPTLRSLAAQRNFEVGAAAATYWLNDSMYRNILSTQYSSITPDGELNLGVLSPSRGIYNWTGGDAILAFADAHGMTVHGHALVQNASWGNPQWLTTGTFTRAELLTILHDHITTVVSRYRGRIPSWDVVNEALDGNGAWNPSQWYTVIGPDYVDSAYVWARRADPGAQLYYNDYGGESMTPKADSIVKLVSQLRSRGIPLDGIGMQTHFSLAWTPPVSSVVQNMNRLALLGLDIRFSEFDVWIQDSQAGSSAALAQQATTYGDMLGACLSVPRCRAFTSWGFTDLHSWVPATFPGWGTALPFDAQYRPKPAFYAMITSLSGN